MPSYLCHGLHIYGNWILNCRCYIKLHDTPPKLATEEDNDKSNLAPSQKKKMKQKQRKAEARAKKVNRFLRISSGLVVMTFVLNILKNTGGRGKA